jgi:hypothetical protein
VVYSEESLGICRKNRLLGVAVPEYCHDCPVWLHPGQPPLFWWAWVETLATVTAPLLRIWSSEQPE